MSSSPPPVNFLTVKEQAPLPTAAAHEYSLVLALSDAGARSMGNQTQRLQGRPPVEQNTTYLWQSGCLVDDERWDCDTACENATLVWNDANAAFTYQNCLVKPLLALGAAEHWLVEHSPGLLQKYGISPDGSRGFGDDPQRALRWPAINDCTRDFCREIRPHAGYCLGGLGHQKFKYAVGSYDPPWHPDLRVDTKFCSRGYNTPNTDLGGPGVLASYIQLLAIVILSWTVLRIPELCLAIRPRKSRAISKARLSRREKLWASIEAFKAHPATTATISALKDFQEAQIFFSITLNIASIIALYKSETRLQAPTVAELVANRFLFKIIGAIGLCPVVLNLCTLRHDPLALNRFVLAASFCCIVFATTTWSVALATSLEKNQLQRDDYQFPTCGGENPMQHCFGDLAVDRVVEWWMERWSLKVFADVFLGGPAIFVPVLAFAGLFAKKNLDLSSRFKSCDKQEQENRRRILCNVLDRILDVFLPLAELWLFLSTIMLLLAVSFLLVPVSHRQPHWQIGQILAVAVWVPVLIKWLHLLLGGLQTRSDCQKTNGHVIVRHAIMAMHIVGAIVLAPGFGRTSVDAGDDARESLMFVSTDPAVSSAVDSLPDQNVSPQQLDDDGLPNRTNTMPV